MSRLYTIAGCNGAGKTTASYTILPELLACHEFVNADNIAFELSPDDVGSVAIESGRIMINKMNELMALGVDFAIETTLSTKSYVTFIKRARAQGYEVTLLYFWLSTPQTACERVVERVSEGGHDIPEEVIFRRYFRGIKNLIELYMPLCDNSLIVDNNQTTPEVVYESNPKLGFSVINPDIWFTILSQYDESK